VLVQTFAGFVVLRLFDGPFGLRAAVRKAVRRSRPFGLTPLGPLARGAQIDKVAHAKLGGDQICSLAVLALVWNKYADTVTLDHGNRQTQGAQFRLPYRSVAIPADPGKTRLLEGNKYHELVQASSSKI
jgi:hypothetical protein